MYYFILPLIIIWVPSRGREKIARVLLCYWNTSELCILVSLTLCAAASYDILSGYAVESYWEFSRTPQPEDHSENWKRPWERCNLWCLIMRFPFLFPDLSQNHQNLLTNMFYDVDTYYSLPFRNPHVSVLHLLPRWLLQLAVYNSKHKNKSQWLQAPPIPCGEGKRIRIRRWSS